MVSPDNVVEFVKDGLNGSPKWRLTVSLLLVALCIYAIWGHFNYANAGDVQSIKSEVTGIKAQLLSQSILTAHEQVCQAQNGAGNNKSYWVGQLAKLRNEYWQLTGQSFELPPSC